MANTARRKEKQRLKRQKKKAQLRRAQAASPYKRIGSAGEVEACYLNSDWRERGMASIYLLRRNPAGGFAMAGFLIDTWCVGLKDAWACLDYTREDFQRQIERASDAWGVSLTRLDPADVRRLVAASIRQAQRHGFRLPRHYERYTCMLGPLPAVDDRDLASFGKDGRLLWVGPLDDLRERLIGSTLEQFMQRPDVDFVAPFGGEGFGLGDDDEDEDEAAFDELADECKEELEKRAQRLAGLIREHCRSTNRAPAERLDDGVRVLLATALLGQVERIDPRTDPDWDEQWLAANRAATDEVFVQLIGTPSNLKEVPGLREAVQQAYAAIQEVDADDLARIGQDEPDQLRAAPSLPGQNT